MRPFIMLIFLFTLFTLFTLCILCPAHAATISGRVVGVHDGDRCRCNP